MPDPEYTFRPVDDGHDPFAFSFRPVDPDHDPFANQSGDLYSDPRLRAALEAQGPEQRQSRLDILRGIGSDALSALMPFSAMRYPDTPEARRAWDAATQGTLGKIPPVPGSSRFDPLAGGLLDVGSSMLPLGKAAAAAKPVLGIFAGTMAKTADRTALAAAKSMEARGAMPRDIWNQTGWFKGKDEQWRFEIPDKPARWTSEPGYGKGSTTTMKDVLHHPELYAAYPDIADMPISKGLQRWSGLYTPPEWIGRPVGSNEALIYGGEKIQINRADPSSPRSIVLHELQHAVQEREGFDPGGMPDVNVSDPKYRGLSPEEIYHRGAGETEARSVERRQNWSKRQRQEQPPYITQSRDVDWLLQILSKP